MHFIVVLTLHLLMSVLLLWQWTCCSYTSIVICNDAFAAAGIAEVQLFHSTSVNRYQVMKVNFDFQNYTKARNNPASVVMLFNSELGEWLLFKCF